ncbi:hypothetical protein [Pelagibius sp. 7325]|uniref:hypothetical protein n=1 Tax=Pelagibius sp. 7325 TaxID=3131994 RepID=UPI0030EBC6CE
MPIREISLAEVPPGHPAAVFFRFWQQAADGSAWVPWRRFDATEHPGILPWVLLLRREPDETGGGSPRWRYSVCGTGCTELFGFSYQGKLFGEGMPAEAAAERLAEFQRVISGEGPLFFVSHLPIPDREFVRVLRGLFAFSSNDDGDIDRLFVVVAREDTQIA